MIISALRQYRLFGIAAFDVIISYVITFIIIWNYNHKTRAISDYNDRTMQVALLSLWVFPLAIVVHSMLSIDTALNKRLGLAN